MDGKGGGVYASRCSRCDSVARDSCVVRVTHAGNAGTPGERLEDFPCMAKIRNQVVVKEKHVKVIALVSRPMHMSHPLCRSVHSAHAITEFSTWHELHIARG